jgi:hypothetical protein
VRVSLKDKDIAASSAKIFLYTPHDLADFFEDLAVNWKGWEGVKDWASIEEDFALTCKSDNLGHVAMEVTLKSGLYEDDWCVKAVIYMDAGQLDAIASGIRRFLHA